MIGFFFKAYIDTLDLFLKWDALEKVLFIYIRFLEIAAWRRQKFPENFVIKNCQVVLFENDDNYIVLWSKFWNNRFYLFVWAILRHKVAYLFPPPTRKILSLKLFHIASYFRENLLNHIRLNWIESMASLF